MGGKDPPVGEDVDSSVKRPAQHRKHRATDEQPDQAKGESKDDEAVTAVVKLPDELEALGAVGIGQQGPRGPSQQPPDPDRRRDGEAEDIGENTPKRRPPDKRESPED